MKGGVHSVLDELDDDLTSRRGKLSLAASRSGGTPATKGPQDIGEKDDASARPERHDVDDKGGSLIGHEKAMGSATEGDKHSTIASDHPIFKQLCADCHEKTKSMKH